MPSLVDRRYLAILAVAAVGLCKSSHWVFQPFCPADQVCDFVPDTTAGCVAGTVCAKCRGLR